MSITRLRPVVLAMLAAACQPSSSPTPSISRSNAYVLRLGSDTIAVDQFTRFGNRIEGTLVQRAPRTVVTRYAITLNPSGSPSLAESNTRLPDGSLIPNGARSTTVTYTGDSAITQIQRDTLVTLRSAARGVLPYINYAIAFFQLPIDALRAAGTDSIGSAILSVGARNPTPMSAVRRGGNRYQVIIGGYRYHVTTDGNGIVQMVDGTGTTQQMLASRQDAIDVAGVAAMWAQRERESRAMGLLSPRDTVRATLGAAQLLVDYGRPSARGRKVFGANGVLNDTLWRTGANQATQFRTSVPIMLGGQRIPAGLYTLWTLAIPGRYQLIVNKQTGQWGTVYDPKQDLVRVPLTATRLQQVVDRFTILVDPSAANAGTLRLRWDTTELSVPITVPE